MRATALWATGFGGGDGGSSCRRRQGPHYAGRETPSVTTKTTTRQAPNTPSPGQSKRLAPQFRLQNEHWVVHENNDDHDSCTKAGNSFPVDRSRGAYARITLRRNKRMGAGGGGGSRCCKCPGNLSTGDTKMQSSRGATTPALTEAAQGCAFDRSRVYYVCARAVFGGAPLAPPRRPRGAPKSCFLGARSPATAIRRRRQPVVVARPRGRRLISRRH
ncbi:hypothetical protein HPB50_004698 [Hyalomma asiaticum]|uniref:Uncharacterized protein n=1 Tax=Hyalomma asiaticum TaxID=266040 RepID=A0ACB7SSN3_HYAAI|nr:hypothetical protein HPB50_004698 [Hyalomma asiaticum]